MKARIKAALKSSLQRLGVGITSYSELEELRRNARALEDLSFLRAMPGRQAGRALQHLDSSKSQLRQDLMVLCELNFKRGGYFVEFGATNGVDLSNSHLLETAFGWSGLLVEPAKCWHSDLHTNRTSIVDTRCVWKESGREMNFKEVAVKELSTLQELGGDDNSDRVREKATTYKVKTVSLNDLLDEHHAPRLVDYLSIDTEGSELHILQALDFEKYRFRVITCEHNYSATRNHIHLLLKRNGYVRRYEAISQFDDWFILADA